MVDYVAVLVAAVAAYVVGMLWYSVLFGKRWMKLMKLKKKDIENAKQKGVTTAYIGMFATQLVMAGVLAYFIELLNMSSLLQGAIVGFWVWLGFYATTMMTGVFWENKPWALYFLNASHWLVVLVVMGAIIGVW